MARRDFEVGLEMTDDGTERPFAERVRRAATAAAGDLVCVVPALDPKGELADHALVRLPQDGELRFIAVHESAEGLVLHDEAAIDDVVLSFARSSAAVLERMGSDDRVRAQTHMPEPVKA